MLFNDTIAAIATAPGAGAIAVIRLSGPDAIDLISEHFNPVGPKKLSEQDSHTIHLGDIVFNQQIIDQALVSLFKAPRSYTGENVVEISCHGMSAKLAASISRCMNIHIVTARSQHCKNICINHGIFRCLP